MKRVVPVLVLSACTFLRISTGNPDENRPSLSVVADDDRVPTLGYRSLGGIAPDLNLQCVLANDTGRVYSYEAGASRAPFFTIERLRDGRWRQTGEEHSREGFTRLDLPTGATLTLSVSLSGVQTPFRVRVDLRARDGGSLSIVGREIRVPMKGPPRFEDVPLMLCDLVSLKRIHMVEPAWPEVARRAHMEGEVVLEVVVGRDGNVSETRLLKGSPILGAAALQAVKQWRYEPPRDYRGRSVAVYFPVTIKFQMETGKVVAE